MKSIAITFGLIVSASTCFSQLLRKDVYDFSVGDLYSVRYTYHAQMSGVMRDVRYEMYRILEKHYNSDSSQVNYFAQKQTYVPPLPLGNGAGTQSEFFIDSVTFSHAQLLAEYSIDNQEAPFGITWIWLMQDDEFSCTKMDSSYTVEYCNSFTVNRFNFGVTIDNPASCSVETPISHYFVGEKIGGPYGEWHYVGMGDPTAVYGGVFLDYYYKDGQACGDFPGYFLGMEEYEINQFTVYPVPASEILHIEGDLKIERMELIDLNNQVLLSTSTLLGNKLDINQLPSGVYFLRIHTGKGTYENHRVIKS